MENERRIGVYICWCGLNIAGVVNSSEVAKYAGTLPNVVIARDYKYMCSDPGQAFIKEDIKNYDLNRVVVASCSPRMHELTFRRACQDAGLNPYLYEHANIREQCSWPHAGDKKRATQKAKDLVRAAVERVYWHEPLEIKEAPVNPNVLVVGGGIAGIQASLDIANSEHKVYLVEKDASIGGHMIQLDRTFPTLDCSECILTPKMTEVGQHPFIELLAYSEVEEVSGAVGNFKVKVRKKARYIDENKCVGCDVCEEVCPRRMYDEFEVGLKERGAAYIPFAQAIPNIATIDKREERPCNAACKEACPIHMNIPGYLLLIKEGKFKQAYELIRRTNPLPAVCGRVCYAPCEDACNRIQLDEPLASRALKMFVTEQIDIDSLEIPEITPKEKKVAIIGSGPAGLSAAHDLAFKGYSVTMFEALPEPGGMLRYGIPEYRLPKDVLRKEIGYIQRLGVEIKTNHKIDTLDPLFEQGYQAILVTVGSPQSVRRGAVVSALSGRPGLLKGFRLESARLDGQSLLKVDFGTFATSREGIFAAGDVTTGPTSVISAIASGKKAARSINEYLEGEVLTSKEDKRTPEKLGEQELAALRERFTSQNRVKAKEIESGERISGFEEVEKVYSVSEAQEEAGRCLASQIEGCIGCGECEEDCEAKAIDFSQQDQTIEIEVGTIIVATGYDIFDASRMPQYGYGKYDNVLTGMEFERMTCAGGPTSGKIQLKDGREPESVAIIHCVGSRDKNYHPYCSRVCCMYGLKHAHLVKELTENRAEVYEFYIDMRSFSKACEEFYERTSQEGVKFIRGKAAQVTDRAITEEEKEKLIVVAEDTLLGQIIRVPVDMAILCVGMEARTNAADVASKFTLTQDADGFFIETHLKLAPMETPSDGVFLAGCCLGPKDIPDTVAQASGAAAKALSMISKGRITQLAAIACVDEIICQGCGRCEEICTFHAPKIISKNGSLVSSVNEAVCKGCGACAVVCPTGAMSIRHFNMQQIESLVDGLLEVVHG